jgi:hypothetical protein
MKLYANHETGRWVGTKAEAKKEFGVGHWEQEVPTDKISLIAFLNVLSIKSSNRPVVDDARIVQATTPTHQSSTPVSLFEAAKGASLSDLQHVVYRYLEKIDDELDLRRST